MLVPLTIVTLRYITSLFCLSGWYYFLLELELYWIIKSSISPRNHNNCSQYEEGHNLQYYWIITPSNQTDHRLSDWRMIDIFRSLTSQICGGKYLESSSLELTEVFDVCCEDDMNDWQYSPQWHVTHGWLPCISPAQCSGSLDLKYI